MSGDRWFDRDDVITVVATASDGTDATEATSAPVVVLDSPPTAPGLAFQPEVPVAGDPLTCVIVTPSTDPDADPLTYRFEWTLDGAAFPDAADIVLASVVAGDAVGEADTWTCTATADDGTLDGPSTTLETTNACTGQWWYDDADGDGYGDPATGVQGCEQPRRCG